MLRTIKRAFLICAIALLAVPAAVEAKSAAPYSPREQKSFDAVFTKWVQVTKTPAGKPVFALQPKTFYEGRQQRLLVLRSTTVAGKLWLKVRLPAWYSHGLASGWVNADNVKLRINRWRVDVSRAEGTLKILHDGTVVKMTHVGTGTDSTPTPRGLNATYDHWRSNESVLGDWTVSLTTSSPEVPVFGGVRAVVAIHGWHADGGSNGAVSHGCIRVASDSVMKMVALELPEGTPVMVT